MPVEEDDRPFDRGVRRPLVEVVAMGRCAVGVASESCFAVRDLFARYSSFLTSASTSTSSRRCVPTCPSIGTIARQGGLDWAPQVYASLPKKPSNSVTPLF